MTELTNPVQGYHSILYFCAWYSRTRGLKGDCTLLAGTY
jgi:hypothetical protein